MKLPLNTVAMLLAVAVMALLILSVWTQDSRFAVTAGMLLVPAVITGFVAGARAHAERCPGC